MKIKLEKSKRLQGRPKVPGDKSISHRGLILGALSQGTSEIIDLLESEDVQSTARCLRTLGISIERKGSSTLIQGRRKWNPPSIDLDCGNSGTTLRVLMGVLAGKQLSAKLTGDASLMKRPMKRVASPISKMGARFKLQNENFPPVMVSGAPLHGIDYEMSVASAQVKTAIILAAISAEGETRLSGTINSRDHTERLLPHFGGKIETLPGQLIISGSQTLYSNQIKVPGDPSTAAFWMGAASVIPGAEIVLENIGLNPTRLGALNVLCRMGARIEYEVTSTEPEPVGNIMVRSAPLQGVEILASEVPSLIDELPLLAVIATQAHGTTTVRGAEELRVKESDRLNAIAVSIRKMGGAIELFEDGFQIVGPQKLRGAEIETDLDHRIAMAFSIAALFADGESSIHDAECVAVSYPGFYAELETLVRA